MTINCYSLGKDKRLCDVVFAGSHDAGIYEGGAPTRAQRDSIEVQAGHGARFFDVRVGAFKTLNKVNPKTFRADDSLQLNRRMDVKLKSPVTDQVFGKQNMKIMALPVGGHAGEGLHSFLNGAMLHVASYHHHSRATNAGDRFGMNNLFKSKDAYRNGYNGIQYDGKGGMTRDLSGEKSKFDGNAGLQKAKMVDGARAQGCQELGMVYVTAAGGIGSLKNRDKKLWKEERINLLLDIWDSDDVAHNITLRLPGNVDPSQRSSAAVIKNFFPNIVMMDCTDRQRCRTVFDINRQAPGPMGEQRTLLRAGSAQANQARANPQTI